MLAAVAPAGLLAACASLRDARTDAASRGRVHVVDSTSETVKLGAFDGTPPLSAPPISCPRVAVPLKYSRSIQPRYGASILAR
jgi:hypothetical protein